MDDLTTRQDDWSFQIMAEGSARFFVRVNIPTTSNASMMFSDFILNPDDDVRAVKALHLLREHGYPIKSTANLVFQNIYPSYKDNTDRTELVRRHDQIVGVVKEYAAQANLIVKNAILEPRAGKFDTVILIG